MSSAASPPSAASDPSAVTAPWLLGLGLVSAAPALAGPLFARLSPSPLDAATLTFGGAATSSLLALTLASKARSTIVASGLLALVGLCALGLGALRLLPGVASEAAVNLGLACLAHALGATVGQRVQQAGHLLPACAVGAAADLASVFLPEGPTHTLASSEQGLALSTVSFAVPGTTVWAPALGFGDLAFVALLLGVTHRHGLSRPRVFVASLAGVSCAGALSAWLGRAIPAIPPIAAAVLLALPAARQVPPADRRITRVALSLAVAALLGTWLRLQLGSAAP